MDAKEKAELLAITSMAQHLKMEGHKHMGGNNVIHRMAHRAEDIEFRARVLANAEPEDVALEWKAKPGGYLRAKHNGIEAEVIAGHAWGTWAVKYVVPFDTEDDGDIGKAANAAFNAFLHGETVG